MRGDASNPNTCHGPATSGTISLYKRSVLHQFTPKSKYTCRGAHDEADAKTLLVLVLVLVLLLLLLLKRSAFGTAALRANARAPRSLKTSDLIELLENDQASMRHAPPYTQGFEPCLLVSTASISHRPRRGALAANVARQEERREEEISIEK